MSAPLAVALLRRYQLRIAFARIANRLAGRVIRFQVRIRPRGKR